MCLILIDGKRDTMTDCRVDRCVNKLLRVQRVKKSPNMSDRSHPKDNGVSVQILIIDVIIININNRP